MTNLENAKRILFDDEYTCVLCKGDIIYTSKERGIRPLLEWLREGIDMTGFSAADKIIGKAAALLFVLSGVSEIYSPVMSEGAVSVFSLHGIKYKNDKTVDYIINRKADGQCPMELAVADINDPLLAFEVLKKKSNELRVAAQSQSNDL